MMDNGENAPKNEQREMLFVFQIFVFSIFHEKTMKIVKNPILLQKIIGNLNALRHFRKSKFEKSIFRISKMNEQKFHDLKNYDDDEALDFIRKKIEN